MIQGFDSSNFDPSHPLVAYGYLVEFVILIKSVLVIYPLIRLYCMQNNPGFLLKLYKKLDKRTINSSIKEILTKSQRRQFNMLFFIELILLFSPAAAALAIRCYLGTPGLIEWNQTQLIIGLGFGVTWATIHFWQALKLQALIKHLEFIYSKPIAVRGSLTGAILTRNGLKYLSEIELNEIERNPEEIQIMKEMLVKSEGSIVGIDGQAIKENVIEIGKKTYTGLLKSKEVGKGLIKELSTKSLELYNDKIQSKVDEYTGVSLSKKIRDMTFDLIMVVSPLFLIYLILQLLE